VFTWTYNDLKGIPLEFAQHIIVLDTLIPPTHQTRYKLNLNYGAVVKHDINKLLVVIVMTFLVRECYGSPKKQEF
jgi:hypothetical protein